MKVIMCTWRTCGKCRAPMVRPLPAGWSYTVQRRRSGIDRVTPHLPQCPKGFVAIDTGVPDE